ncbi:GNAT family N-acetyltransferase [Nakamurella sp. YIM 132087]|uniref:GNAT family N-acetyltransferase n=1 Tax=Nakamurella alba TaxID=2665158 RepID=A0A7K1FG93_9ACTN|nr:GNAT family N-acetyltransferase [Nakamurella alba]MTD13127.1 GNAT family N-acetyltransferase [Nakamurella alba]
MTDAPTEPAGHDGTVVPDEIVSRRVGPAATMAADSAFAVALVTLWHRVSLAGGAVGFLADSTRPEIAARAAGVVDGLKRGRTRGQALTAGRTLVGFGLLTPGESLVAHTGMITLVMIDPDHQRQGLGDRIMEGLLEQARELGIERLELTVRGGEGLERFYARFGFEVEGSRPGWIRVAPGDDRDEVFLRMRLA